MDTLSATLLHQLECPANVRLLVAVRASEPVADAVVALWRDGVAQRVGLQPLGATM